MLGVAVFDQNMENIKLAERAHVQAGEVLWPWLPVTEARTVAAAGSVRHDVVLITTSG